MITKLKLTTQKYEGGWGEIVLNLGDKLCSQGVPPLELVVRILQGVVPVLQALAFGINAELYSTYQQQITNIFLPFGE